MTDNDATQDDDLNLRYDDDTGSQHKKRKVSEGEDENENENENDTAKQEIETMLETWQSRLDDALESCGNQRTKILLNNAVEKALMTNQVLRRFDDHLQVSQLQLKQLCSVWKRYSNFKEIRSMKNEEKLVSLRKTIEVETLVLETLQKERETREQTEKVIWIQSQTERAALAKLEKQCADLRIAMKASENKQNTDDNARKEAQEKLNAWIAELNMQHATLMQSKALLEANISQLEEKKSGYQEVKEVSQRYRSVFPWDPAKMYCANKAPTINILQEAQMPEEMEEVLQEIYEAVAFEFAYDLDSLDSTERKEAQERKNIDDQSCQHIRLENIEAKLTLRGHLQQIQELASTQRDAYTKERHVAQDHVKELQYLLTEKETKSKARLLEISQIAHNQLKKLKNRLVEEKETTSKPLQTCTKCDTQNCRLMEIVNTYGCSFKGDGESGCDNNEDLVALIEDKFLSMRKIAKQYDCFTTKESRTDPLLAITSKLRLWQERLVQQGKYLEYFQPKPCPRTPYLEARMLLQVPIVSCSAFVYVEPSFSETVTVDLVLRTLSTLKMDPDRLSDILFLERLFCVVKTCHPTSNEGNAGPPTSFVASFATICFTNQKLAVELLKKTVFTTSIEPLILQQVVENCP